MKKCKWCKIQESIWKIWRFVDVANFIKLRYLHRRVPARHMICQKNYPTGFSGGKVYTLKVPNSRLYLLIIQHCKGMNISNFIKKLKNVVRMSYLEREIWKWGKTYINFGEMHTCNNKNLSTNITKIIQLYKIYIYTGGLLNNLCTIAEGPYWEALILTSGTSHLIKE